MECNTIYSRFRNKRRKIMSSTQEVQVVPVQSQEVAPQQLSPEMQYLQSLFDRFNANKDHEELTPAQKVLLSGVAEHEKNFAELAKQLDTLNTEIADRQKKVQEVRDVALRTKGSSDGLVGALLKLKA